MAFLATQKAPLPPEKGPERDPTTRARPVGFGDNLDPTNNPAVVRAEGADDSLVEKGPAGKACADCHAGGALSAMKGVATRYPRFVAAYGRVMSIEDFLTVHAPATTGRPLPEESVDNLDLTVRIKMASNDMPVRLDLGEAREPARRSSVARRASTSGSASGTTPAPTATRRTTGAAPTSSSAAASSPTSRTGSPGTSRRGARARPIVWDMRKRMQWCMTPLGMNMLAADAVEYAELELFLASFDQGKPMSVPGIRH